MLRLDKGFGEVHKEWCWGQSESKADFVWVQHCWDRPDWTPFAAGWRQETIVLDHRSTGAYDKQTLRVAHIRWST